MGEMFELLRAIEAFEEREFSGPVDEARIEAASQTIGLPFPRQFKMFLASLGSGAIASEEFMGLGGPQHLDVSWLTPILRQRNRALPPQLIPIRADGYGNYDCIDTTQPTTDGEFAVVEWIHDGSQKGEILASSYFEWFQSILALIRKDGMF